MKLIDLVRSGAVLVAALALLSALSWAQPKPAPTKPVPSKRVTVIDTKTLESLIKPKGKPLLINFWATWCDPCREEFPDLVKLDAMYRGKVDVITISLDDVEDIDGVVTKFLAEMKAEMPAYLLKTDDQDAAIQMVSKDWAGNLPLTMFVDTAGKVAYLRNGKLRFDTVKENIDRVLGTVPAGNTILETIDFIKVKDGKRDEARYYYENNWRFYRAAAVKRGLIDSFEYIDTLAGNDAAFDIILITRYRGDEQYRNRETALEPIIKELTPKGPFLKGMSKPDEFRQVVYSYAGRAVFTSSN